MSTYAHRSAPWVRARAMVGAAAVLAALAGSGRAAVGGSVPAAAPKTKPKSAAPVPSRPVVPATRGAPRCPPAMIPIPAGELQLGDGDAPRADGERRVRVQPFCIDRTEVTASVSARSCARCVPGPAFAESCVPEADMPAGCLAADEAEAHCRTRRARLPTDDEWEMAARGPSPQRYPWGEDPTAPGGAVCAGKGLRTDEPTTIGPCPVGGSPGDRSPFGVMDLDGNLSEWTSTVACQGDRSDCTDERIVRGGSWSDEGPAPLGARRMPMPVSSAGVGFRCAADPLGK